MGEEGRDDAAEQEQEQEQEQGTQIDDTPEPPPRKRRWWEKIRAGTKSLYHKMSRYNA